MLRGFTPFCAFAGRRYPPITNNPTAIGTSAARRDERSEHNFFCIMAFDWRILWGVIEANNQFNRVSSAKEEVQLQLIGP
jgi:hypothetical protein